MTRSLLYFYLAAIVVILSCGEQYGYKGNSQNWFLDSTSNSVPQRFQGEFREKWNANLLKLKLKSIDKGFDGSIIRIVRANALDDTIRLLEVAKMDNHFSGRYLLFNNDIIRKELPGFFLQEGHEPKSGWKEIFQSLERLNIASLPDEEMLQGYRTPMDGSNVIIEVAKKNGYRIFSYGTPEYNQNFEEVKYLIRGLEILNNELDTKFWTSQ